MKKIITLSLLANLLLYAASLSAASLLLKDGSIVSGKIESQDLKLPRFIGQIVKQHL